MSREDIVNRIRAFLEEEFPQDGTPLTDRTRLFEDYILDSFAIIQVVLFLEGEFGIRMARADINAVNFGTVGSLADFVVTRLVSKAR